MIRLFVIFGFLVVVALVVTVIAFSRYIDRQQEARKDPRDRETGNLPCAVCGGFVWTANDDGLCLDHQRAMREVDKWAPKAEEA